LFTKVRANPERGYTIGCLLEAAATATAAYTAEENNPDDYDSNDGDGYNDAARKFGGALRAFYLAICNGADGATR